MRNFTHIHERNFAESRRIAAERNRAMFAGGAILRKGEEEKNQANRVRKYLSEAQKERWTLKASSKIILLGMIPEDQYHLAAMTPCQAHGQNFQLYFCVLTKGETPCQMRREGRRKTICQTMTNLERISCRKRNHHRQTCQTANR